MITSKRVLIPVMTFLFACALFVPFGLKQIPLALRLVLSFTDLAAGAALALFLRQQKRAQLAETENG